MVSLVAVLMVLDIDFPDSMVVAVNAELVIYLTVDCLPSGAHKSGL